MQSPISLPATVRTPTYILDVALLKRNLATAARIRAESGCRLLLATKSFAMPAAFHHFRDVVDGTTASGEFEARIGHNEFGKETHVYAPAYTDTEMSALIGLAGHIYFNSPGQIERFRPYLRRAPHVKVGLRINPGYSEATIGGDLYNPCAPCSRFGATREMLENAPWEDIHTLHVHALCEATHNGSVGLIEHVAREFVPYIRRVKAVNFGGGHSINKQGYNVDALIDAIKRFKAEFGVEVILEPGASLLLNAGWLVTTVLDIHHNGKPIAILDTSASCHMPDVLEIPYMPPIPGAAAAGVHPHNYILAGKTCMTGDVIGEYSFPDPLRPGDRLVIGDMVQYTFVKNNTFNGTPLPDLAILEEDGTFKLVKSFGYEDFRSRLG